MSGDSEEQMPGAGRDETGTDFFTVGAPLHAVRAGYVRRRADDVLLETLVACRYAHVIAPKRSGKSSLVAATAARLENNGFKVAILDLEQLGVRDIGSDAGRWYYNIAYRLLRQLRIRTDLQTWWHDRSMLSNRQRLFEFYADVVLRNVKSPVVVFVDEIQYIGELEFADQLLASIRAAHNARGTDPEFSRLAFALLGECDPASLVAEPELSPFSVTQAVPLEDFSREDLDLFVTELNLEHDRAERALDRIHYWTRGQPYLTQKLARAVSRERPAGDVAESVDRIVSQQLIGRSALNNEPHMSHIHRAVLSDARSEALLNLYGRIRKGVGVTTDLASPLQRKLVAIGLVEIDAHGELRVRNRIYERTFTARWANENLPTHWRGPAVAAAVLLVMLAVPFLYTQLLPKPYVAVLTAGDTSLEAAETSWLNLRSFPGHTAAADNLYRNFLRDRARQADDFAAIAGIAAMAERIPDPGTLPAELSADFWDRRSQAAIRQERRDEALIASLEALVLPTPRRRNRAAMLIGDDYPLLLSTLPTGASRDVVFNPATQLVTATDGARVSQWSLAAGGLTRRDDWTMTALEVTPLVRRVIVDRPGEVSRIGLTLNLSHARLADLRIKVIAPSGRAVEIRTGRERASVNDDIRIVPSALAELVGEPLAGTWSLSVRDEALGISGHLGGWNLTLNSQGLVEDFQRGIDIPDPVERRTDNIWTSRDGRYAVARATQSDSARIWDLSFAKPVRAIAVSETEQLIGVDANARRLVTATPETVNLWEVASGTRAAAIATGAATSRLTADGMHLLVERRSDVETLLEIWSLETANRVSGLAIAGTPAMIAADAAGTRVAVADFDRAVRIWDVGSGEMLGQIALPRQPSRLSLSAGGEVLGVVYGDEGASLWRLGETPEPVFEEFADGGWRLAFSPSGEMAVVGRPRAGYRIYRSRDGRVQGPAIGIGGPGSEAGILAFSADERVVVTPAGAGAIRFWRVAPAAVFPGEPASAQPPLSVSADAVAVATADAGVLVTGDRSGQVHMVDASGAPGTPVGIVEDVSFIGHSAAVRMLAVSASGEKVASVAADNTVRVWRIADGEPAPFIVDIPGAPVTAVSFSPSGERIGVLNGSRLEIVDAASGEIEVEIELGEPHTTLAFADDASIWVGSAGGALRLVSFGAQGGWSVQQVWQGSAAIRLLRASPRGRRLVLVDADDVAQQFSLVDGQIGSASVQLPGPVEDAAFVPNGSRVLFRTTRWVHRVSASPAGLVWLDAVLVPKPLAGAGMVFGREASYGNLFYLPVARDGAAMLAKIEFAGTEAASLFGSREGLLAEWRRRLAVDPPQPDPMPIP